MTQVATVETSDLLRIALIVLIAAVLLVPLAVRISQRAFDPFEPICLFAAVYGAMFVIRPSAMLIRGDLAYEGPTRLDITPTFTKMLVVALLGAVGFVAGYLSPAGTRLAGALPVIKGPRDLRLTGLVACALGAAGALAFVIVLASARGLNGISLFFAGRSVELKDLFLPVGRNLHPRPGDHCGRCRRGGSPQLAFRVAGRTPGRRSPPEGRTHRQPAAAPTLPRRAIRPVFPSTSHSAGLRTADRNRRRGDLWLGRPIRFPWPR
jgi:hypothetical protein